MTAQIVPFQDFFDEAGTQPTSQKAANRKARKAVKEERQRARTGKPFTPRNEKQAAYKDSLENNELTFGIGPAGAGKTYVPACVFGEQLALGKIAKLYVARPNIAKNKHRNGFLPGDEKEKTAPWLVPIMEGLRDSMGKGALEKAMEQGIVEVVPYEFIQGRTFRDDKGAACIVDEAENLDLDDLYITLTRQGENLNMVLCGDIYQSRIPDSGLAAVIEMAEEDKMEGIGVVEFTSDEVVRSRQAAQWVKAFEKRRKTVGGFGGTAPAFMER